VPYERELATQVPTAMPTSPTRNVDGISSGSAPAYRRYTAGDRPGHEQASADHDPEQDLHELAPVAGPRITGLHQTREVRIILIERPLDLLRGGCRRWGHRRSTES